MMLAVQPAMRDIAKMGVNRRLGIPSDVYTEPEYRSTLGYRPLVFDVRTGAGHVGKLGEQLHHALVGSAMERALERADRAHHC